MAITGQQLRIGDVLLENGFISEEQLKKALVIQKDPDQNPERLKIGDMLLKLGYVSETQLVHVLSTRLKVQYVDLTNTAVDPVAAGKIPVEFAKKNNCIGYRINGKRLFVATNDPINFITFDQLKIVTGCDIFPMLSTKTGILNAIEEFYQEVANSEADAMSQELENQNAATDDMSKEERDRLAADAESADRVDSAPIVKLVNNLVEQAYRKRSSDIHIEPFHDRTRIRYRLDGELSEQMVLKPSVHNTLVTRIKILGNMNIAERRIPLDGRMSYTIDQKTFDVRISTLPTVYGEKCVMRLLSTAGEKSNRKVTELGMTAYNYEMFASMIKSPNGVLLVTGPTGSGKSTTLYATLVELSRPDVNVSTVEDPVEKKVDGVNQCQINEKAGMTFSAALRSLLRQDPDIILVGEIRDGETAEIAIRAAITGHLVLSTLHTNDAASSILRLIDMGVQPYLVASALIGIIAQRLVRLLCTECKEEIYIEDPAELRLLGVDKSTYAYGPRKGGCKACGGTGYRGRTAIHEILIAEYNIKEIVVHGGTTADIKEQAIKNGTRLLRDNVAEMVVDGKTTMDELVKATYAV